VAVTEGPGHRFVMVNARAEAVVGSRDLVGQTYAEGLPLLAAQGFAALLDRVYATGEPYAARAARVLVPQPDGGSVESYYDFAYQPLRDPQGRVTGILQHAVDVTAPVRAAARTSALQHLTAALAEGRTADAVAEVVVAQAVAVTGAKTGAFIARPPGAAAGVIVRQTGLPAAVSARFATLPLDAPGPAAAALRTGSAAFVGDRAGLEARYPEFTDLWRTLDVAAIATVPLAVGGEDGRPVVVGAMSFTFAAPRAFDAAEEAFFLALGRQAALALERVRLLDTERAARREAEAARAAAEAANRAKGAFLSTMSHELRTPLNAIAGYAELLTLGIRGPLTDAQREDLERLRRANQHMSGLVEAVLTFARVEAGQVDYRVEAVSLAPLLSDVEALVGPQLAARALTYTHDGCGPDTPERPHVVRADAEKVRQILLNLVSNAIKFTDPGGRVSLACEDDAAAGVVRVGVTDTGRGIAPDQLERVFQPFVQVDRHRTHASQQGVGLGLAISRDLARGMGGELTVASTPGHGSVFTLSLPRDRSRSRRPRRGVPGHSRHGACSDSSNRLGRHRWQGERTLAWLARYRRLTIRYERLLRAARGTARRLPRPRLRPHLLELRPAVVKEPVRSMDRAGTAGAPPGRPRPRPASPLGVSAGSTPARGRWRSAPAPVTAAAARRPSRSPRR
jgi:signal transduction histidine kinase